MKKILFSSILAVGILLTFALLFSKNNVSIRATLLGGVEALTSGEGGSFGCGRGGAYQWKDNGIFGGHVNFVKCQSGCPEGEGRDPKYMNC